MRMTDRRRNTLTLVQSGFVSWDLDEGAWLVNGAPVRRWGGRTLSELRREGYIEVTEEAPTAGPLAARLTDAGREALRRD